ncbi:TonB C-terminal domain-containing protein [Bradyrhizobium cenepequi]|uniref:TonB C-terminal domain-containing protein n=1 Tax=Bradyrhizobium cenepequi TaxID=2821403 RepID=UPI001CE3AB59|nr:TonB C-terminal domain-containing protein [Bradyrhizobium cenepequi]MCA6109661.1 TonB C-terminal domain-containing protein [Bradyrhizobium cenepequi]
MLSFAASVVIILWLSVLISNPGRADSSVSGRKAAPRSLVFSIPSQPLGAALEIYARISSREVLYEGALAEGRHSSLVEGVYAPEVALQILLAGTGLWADVKDADFFVVGPVPTGATVRSVERQSLDHRRYYGLLQASLRTVFCGTRVLSDSSRVAARLWVGQAGQVLQVKTLSSTGSDAMDRSVEAALGQISLGVAPPAGFAQPITIVVLPSDPDMRQDCAALRGGPSRAGP